MKQPFFDQERASSYDTKFAAMAPLRAVLDLLTSVVLSQLPADVRVLCVGAGTGSEILHLARTHPGWHFTAVEPAKPMLDICRGRVEESGFSARCTFHEGFLDSLRACEPFDGATALLVSHFIMDKEERRAFFRGIAARLRPGAILVSADLCADMAAPTFKGLLEMWLAMLRSCNLPGEEVETMRASFGQSVALLPPSQVESLIASSGFDAPILFLQTLLIHAHFARRSA